LPDSQLPPSTFPTSFVFSASSLQDYVECPRRFKLRYIDALIWPSAEAEPQVELEAHRRDGILFHRLVHEHVLGLPINRIGDMARSPRVSTWWNNYVNAQPVGDNHAMFPELLLQASVGPHQLVARYDLIALRQGDAEIYEWKTGRSQPRADELAVRWQTRVYMALLARAGDDLNDGKPFAPDRISMTYWFAEFPNLPIRFDYDEARSVRDWDALGNLVTQISEAQEWPLTADTRRCQYCVFRSYCSRGSHAGQTTGRLASLEDVAFDDIGNDPKIEPEV
jgi:CRISPR/Cas system-associated exonuclease Cas4 (RecB family)